MSRTGPEPQKHRRSAEPRREGGAVGGWEATSQGPCVPRAQPTDTDYRVVTAWGWGVAGGKGGHRSYFQQ